MADSKLIKKLDKIFSEYIRLRDADDEGFVVCCTCGVIKHYTKVDCGHFQSRRHMATRWDEINVSTQCKSCNGFHAGEQFKYAQFIDKNYGKGRALILESLARGTKKWSNTDLQEMIDEYSTLLKEQKKERGMG